jgi:hypothetical protein
MDGVEAAKNANAPDDVRAKANWRQNAYVPVGRSLRNVWTIATEAYPGSHFATYPTALVERCIKAGTSERGCCAQCGAPWVRQVSGGGTNGGAYNDHSLDAVAGMSAPSPNKLSGRDLRRARAADPITTTGWAPSCTHDAGVVPCTVLDPFIGSGTTALVADRLQRDAIGIDLNTSYAAMAMERCKADAPLLTEVATVQQPEPAQLEMFAA